MAARKQTVEKGVAELRAENADLDAQIAALQQKRANNERKLKKFDEVLSKFAERKVELAEDRTAVSKEIEHAREAHLNQKDILQTVRDVDVSLKLGEDTIVRMLGAEHSTTQTFKEAMGKARAELCNIRKACNGLKNVMGMLITSKADNKSTHVSGRLDSAQTAEMFDKLDARFKPLEQALGKMLETSATPVEIKKLPAELRAELDSIRDDFEKSKRLMDDLRKKRQQLR